MYAAVNSVTNLCALLAAASIEPDGVLMLCAVLTISSLTSFTSNSSSFSFEFSVEIIFRKIFLIASSAIPEISNKKLLEITNNFIFLSLIFFNHFYRSNLRYSFK